MTAETSYGYEYQDGEDDDGEVELSDEEIARAAATRELVLTLMPEIVPYLIEHVKAGDIRGWRDVTAYRLSDKATRGEKA